MIWLQSNETYNEIAEYDHFSGSYLIKSRDSVSKSSLSNIDGTYAFLSNEFVAIYKFGTEMFVRIGTHSIQLIGDVKITVKGDPASRKLSVKKNKEELVTVNYALNNSNVYSHDPTPFIDDEDFDFGLFISNIASNESRKRVLLGKE